MHLAFDCFTNMCKYFVVFPLEQPPPIFSHDGWMNRWVGFELLISRRVSDHVTKLSNCTAVIQIVLIGAVMTYPELTEPPFLGNLLKAKLFFS